MSQGPSASAHDTTLLSVGRQCAHPSCLLVDFLPFKCQHCSDSFCQEHFKVLGVNGAIGGHPCGGYDEQKWNRVVPSCPVCNEPVPFRPGQDPNVRMDVHLERECKVLVGDAARKTQGSAPRCKKASCNKVLFAPIKCDGCRHQFCPEHRFADDHACTAKKAPNALSQPQAAPALSARERAAQAAQSRVAAMQQGAQKTFGAVKASAATKAAAISAAAAASGPSDGPKKEIKLPFNKVDRRAKAERESRKKALEARAKKGLLTEEEKAFLAAEAAEAKKKKDDDCVVM